MAETRKITIELLSSSDDLNELETRYNDLENKFNKLLSPQKNAKRGKKQEISAKQYFYGKAADQAFQLISQTAKTSINRYFSLSENYMAENSYNNTITLISKGTSLVSTVVAGTATGAKIGGAPGAVIGFALSAGGWGISEAIQNQANLSSYYQSINASNMQTQFSRTRAGLVDNGRGTEN